VAGARVDGFGQGPAAEGIMSDPPKPPGDSRPTRGPQDANHASLEGMKGKLGEKRCLRIYNFGWPVSMAEMAWLPLLFFLKLKSLQKEAWSITRWHSGWLF